MLDPGGTCGLLYGAQDPKDRAVAAVQTAVRPLAGLASQLCMDLRDLRALEMHGDETLLAYEAFTLNPRRRQDHSMPSSVGLGIFHGVACALGYPPPIGIEPGRKTAGHQWARKQLPAVANAYDLAKNDHERDVADLAGYLLRQHSLRKAPFA